MEVHLGTINILLTEHGLKKIDLVSGKNEANQQHILERREDTYATIDGTKDNIEAQALAVKSNSSMLTQMYQIVSREPSASW